MAERTDILLIGTGNFAARIVFDLAATAPPGLSVVIVGRNPARLAWIRTAAAARAAMFGIDIHIAERRLGVVSTETVAGLLEELGPRVVANTASAQGGRTIAERPDRWTALVQTAGLGVSALLQARISVDVSRAVQSAARGAWFVNCCYPDVVNPMIAAAGLPIASGIGNVAILAHAFAGALGPGHGKIQLLAQHAALAAFRRPPEERAGAAPLRMWLGGREVADVFARFPSVKLTPEPAIDVSGASGVPLFIAMALGRNWRGHAPGPNGLPGGYPVRLNDGVLELDLPPGLAEADAVEWNVAFERKSGVIVERDGRVRYAGKVEEGLRSVSPAVAAGFAMGDFDGAYRALSDLRARLRAEG